MSAERGPAVLPNPGGASPALERAAGPAEAPARVPAPALALMIASGFAALGCQIVWTQQSALWLGQESASVLAVVAAFLGGLALGALALGGRIERSARPERWYAACEAAIGLWCLALTVVLVPASRQLLVWIGEAPGPFRHWTVAFAGTFLLLLPATAAMGATLPALERLLARLHSAAVPGSSRHVSSPLAALYAGNTLGAMAGALAAAFWLVPAFGLTRTTIVCATANMLCALIAWRLFAGRSTEAESAAAATTTATDDRRAGLLLRLAATGALGIGYEVLVVRVLAQAAENTVYTFAMLLAVYLAGTAAGAAAWTRASAGLRDETVLRLHTDRLLAWLALACLAGTASLWAAPALKRAWLATAGPGYAAALAAEALMAIVAFLPATLVMGALFSLLGQRALAAGVPLGRAFGANMLGGAAAPALFGVALAPVAGVKGSLLLVAAGYLALREQPPWRDVRAAVLAGACAALAAFAPPLAFVDVPEGGHVVLLREGPQGLVSVVEDGEGVARLHIDNRAQEGASNTLLADARQALLPLLLHPAPRQALFLGVGTGVTAASAAEERTLRVDAVELLPEVIEATRLFVPAVSGATPNPRLSFRVADARRYVRATPRHYDFIVSDNFHPARSGSALLYTVQHFEAVRERLAPGGLFCQWLPLHQLDLETLRSIVGAFVAVHGERAFAVLATYSLETPVIGLMAWPAPPAAGGERADGADSAARAGPLDLEAARLRLQTAALPRPPADFGLGDEFALLGTFVAGPRALAEFARGAPVNDDDRPLVAYRAPRLTYAPDSRPRDRLLALLNEWRIAPEELLAPHAPPATRERLAAYWRARDLFLAAGRDVRPTADARAMLAQVRAPLLNALRASADFRPAYDPLVRMAEALALTEPQAARALLRELVQLQPSWPDAPRALEQIDMHAAGRPGDSGGMSPGQAAGERGRR